MNCICRVVVICLLALSLAVAAASAPVIGFISVSPKMVPKDSAVHVMVQVTSSAGVIGVSANGVDLYNVYGDYWTGDLGSGSTEGDYPVKITAEDWIRGIATDSTAAYKVARVFAMPAAHVKDPLTAMVCGKYLFQISGKVLTVDSSNFMIDDGSPTKVWVVAPDYSGFSSGDYVSACGILNPTTDPPTLSCPANSIVCYTAPAPPPDPMNLTWNPRLYNYGANLQELQVYRDLTLAAQQPGPFYVIASPFAFAQGKVDLTPIYALGANWDPLGHTVNYHEIAANGQSLMAYSLPWVAEGYGLQHTYQLQAIVRNSGPNGFIYSYDWTSFGAPRKMTCLEPITMDRGNIVSPGPNEPILIQDLRNGDVNLSWKSVGGATDYRVIVEPVEPGIGGTWHSSIMYHYCGAYPDGGTLSLSDADRLSLAYWLAPPEFIDEDIRWRVDARNSTDSAPLSWTQSDWNVFHIDRTPPGPPTF